MRCSSLLPVTNYAVTRVLSRTGSLITTTTSERIASKRSTPRFSTFSDTNFPFSISIVTNTTMGPVKKKKKVMERDQKQRSLSMFLTKGVNINSQALKGEAKTKTPSKAATDEVTTDEVTTDDAIGTGAARGEESERERGNEEEEGQMTTQTTKKNKTQTTRTKKEVIAKSPRESTRKREKPEKLDVTPKKKAKAPGPTKYHEDSRREKGYKRICGVDEAGRGPLAGPVIAAACILPEGVQIEGVDDSKKINSEEDRELLYEAIMADKRIETSFWICDEKRIDQINILEATMECMRKSTETLPGGPIDWALIDGNKIPKGLEDKAEAIVKGDAKSQCIATASIVAKVTRDRMMREIDKEYPQYGFKDHKGYGTKAHCAAIEKYGPCPHHRMTFAPIKYMDLTKYE